MSTIQRTGRHRDWVWRGWQVRYAFRRALVKHSDGFELGGGISDRPPPLLFVHGFGASIGHWRQNIEHFAECHSTYAIDLLGFGASEKVEQAFNIQFWVELVHDFWNSFLQCPVVIIGNSIGSLVCMAVAEQYPEMVKGVVLINLPDTTLREEMIPVAVRPVVSKIEEIFTSPLLLKPLFYWLRRPNILRAWASLAYEDKAAISDELIDILATPAQDRGAENTFVSLFQSMPKANFGPSARLTLPKIKVPILLLWGKCDRMIMPKFAKQFASYNPKITLIELENLGHCPHDESPNLVNSILMNWLIDQGLSPIQ